MLDDGPRDQPPNPSQPEPLDPDDVLIESTVPPSATALIRADMNDAWTKLEPAARQLFGASLAAIIIIVVGLPLSVWDSAPFALLVLAASTTTAVTAWFGASPAFRDLPIPRQTIELVAPHVVAVLAVLKAIEILFGLDTDGIVALVIGVALVAAAAAQLMAAQRRGADPLAISRGDQGTKIAAAGLLFVLVGWGLNLSIHPFWTMGQAALPLAVLTIAALTVAEAPRIQSPVPVAWVGAGIAVFGALLALGNWVDLTRLGQTQRVLEPVDFLGIVAYSVGVALIIAGGVLSGRAQWTPPASQAVETASSQATEPAVEAPIDEA